MSTTPPPGFDQTIPIPGTGSTEPPPGFTEQLNQTPGAKGWIAPGPQQVADRALAQTGLPPAASPATSPTPQPVGILSGQTDAEARTAYEARLKTALANRPRVPGPEIGQRFNLETPPEGMEKFVSGAGGYPKIVEGAKTTIRNFRPPMSVTDESREGVLSGINEMAKGAMEAATPAVIAGGLLNPAATAASLAGAGAGGYAAKKVAEKAGASPATQEFVGNIGALAGGFAGGMGAAKLTSVLFGPGDGMVTGPEAARNNPEVQQHLDTFRSTLKSVGIDLPEDATLDQARTAYKQAVTKLHPDINPDADQGALRDLTTSWAGIRDAAFRRTGGATAGSSEPPPGFTEEVPVKGATARPPAGTTPKPSETPNAPAAPQEAQGTPSEIAKQAEAYQPQVVASAQGIADQVPGAKVVDPGAKPVESIERKQEGDRGITDASRAQIVVPDEAAKQQAVQAVSQQLPVHEVAPIKADNLPIVAAKLPNSGEIQVATEQEHKAQAETHPIYQAQQEALARGDKAEADRLGEELAAKQKELTQGVELNLASGDRTSPTMARGSAGAAVSNEPPPTQSQPAPPSGTTALKKGAQVLIDGKPGTLTYLSRQPWEKSRVLPAGGGKEIVVPHKDVAKRIQAVTAEISTKLGEISTGAGAPKEGVGAQPSQVSTAALGGGLPPSTPPAPEREGKVLPPERIIPRTPDEIKARIREGIGTLTGSKATPAQKDAAAETAYRRFQQLPTINPDESPKKALEYRGQINQVIDDEIAHRGWNMFVTPGTRALFANENTAHQIIKGEGGVEKPERELPGAVQGVTSGTPSQPTPKPGAIAWDLDKTLAHYEEGDTAKNPDKIGAPIPENVALAKQQIGDGKDVWIHSARASTPEAVNAIKAWTKENLGVELPVTNTKWPQFSEFYDDRNKPLPSQAAEKPNGAEIARPSAVQPNKEGTNDRTPETVAPKGEPVKTQEKPFKFGSTQANIPHGSDASNAIIQARNRISDSDLAGKGKDVGGEHVTVRYGIRSDDKAGIKAYLASLQPFEATLGKTSSFPPSEHSDGAAVIIAPITSPELEKINSEIEKHGDFTEPSFKEYAPHATIAYVKPEAASRYTGMSITNGQTFRVDEIAITNREGTQEVVPLGGTNAVQEQGPAGILQREPEETGTERGQRGRVERGEQGQVSAGSGGEAANGGATGVQGTQEKGVGTPEYEALRKRLAALEKKVSKPVEKQAPTAKELKAKLSKAAAPPAAEAAPAPTPEKVSERAAPAVEEAGKNPALMQAFADWASGNAYLGTQGRGTGFGKAAQSYRLKAGEYGEGGKNRPAPWSKAVVEAFPDNSAFHDAAKAVFPTKQDALAYIHARDVSPRDEEILRAMGDWDNEKGQDKPNPFEHGVTPGEWRDLASKGLVDTEFNGLSAKGAKALDAIDSKEYVTEKAASGSPTTGAAETPERIVPGARSATTGKETGRSSMQDLTEAIRNQAPPKSSTAKKMEIGAKVGAAADSVGGAASEALGRIKGVGAALWDAYKNPRSSILLPRTGFGVSDYERAVGNWSGADNVSAREINDFRKANEKVVPDKVDQQAISIYTEAGGDQSKLREWAKNIAAFPELKKYAPAFERAADLSEPHRVIANNIATHNDDSLERARDAGIMRDGVENYMMHVWRDNPAMLAKVRAETNWASLQTKPSFSKERTLPTYYDGIMAGFKPQDMSFAFLTATHERALQEAIAARAFIRELHEAKATDGRPLVTTSTASARQLTEEEGQKSEPYMIRPNTKPGQNYADYRPIDHPALRGWRWAANDAEGNPMFVQGDMLVHPEIYRHLKNDLGKSAIRAFNFNVGETNVHPGNMALATSNLMKSSILVGSRFHETQEEVIGAMYRENPFNLVKLDLSEPWQREAVNSGLMVANYDGQMDFAEGLSGAGLKDVPLIGPIVHGYNDHLFKEKIPALKMTTYRNLLERNTATYGDEYSPEKIRFITAKEVNTAFGGLNYKLLGRNKTLQDALRLVAIAPDFAESRAKYVGQAVRPQGRQQLLHYLFGGLVIFALAQTLNELVDHKMHPETPFGVHIKGKVYTLRTPQGDSFRAITDPGGFVTGKASPIVNAVSTLAKSRDDYGRPIPFSKRLQEVGRRDVPIPVQSFTEKQRRGHNDTFREKLANALARIGGLQVTNEPKKHRR